ncbi:hypothetical protein M9H77_26867 [Catharanthus roseus]|uniref:Uncharacterized protein n=1 Tax=Catharanthus roseus TaxID=4058 RepID=A0ACC0AB96_CATRO|nr:hypothetical protein M9H77_26867 [Catharanthus roseus]
MNFSPKSLKLEIPLGGRWAYHARAFPVNELGNIQQHVLVHKYKTLLEDCVVENPNDYQEHGVENYGMVNYGRGTEDIDTGIEGSGNWCYLNSVLQPTRTAPQMFTHIPGCS